MASANPAERKEIATLAVDTMWSGVTDRTERLRNAHENSPGGHNLHARRLFGRDVDIDKLTKVQWQQVAQARRAYLKAMSLKGIRAKRLKQAQRLRQQAAAIEAGEAGDGLA
jgi:hypothetical protein